MFVKVVGLLVVRSVASKIDFIGVITRTIIIILIVITNSLHHLHHPKHHPKHPTHKTPL